MLLVWVSSFLYLIRAHISDFFFICRNMTVIILSQQPVWLHSHLGGNLASCGHQAHDLGRGKVYSRCKNTLYQDDVRVHVFCITLKGHGRQRTSPSLSVTAQTGHKTIFLDSLKFSWQLCCLLDSLLSLFFCFLSAHWRVVDNIACDKQNT